MKEKVEYDVLKLVEHGQICYVSSGCVKGYPLLQWLKGHPQADGETLLRMAGSIAAQLAQIHRCRGNPCYRYVNPYSIIVSEDGTAHFLDVHAESSAAQVRLMQKRNVREYFLPPEEPYYRRESRELDIYGLGKTLQYMIAQTEAEKPFDRSVEKTFQKIISRCLNRQSKKSFQDVSEIQKMIPEPKQLKKKREKTGNARAAAVIAAAVAVAFFAGKLTGKTEGAGRESGKSREETTVRTADDDAAEEENEELNLELGTLCFLELNDYERSRECFESAENNRLAGDLAVAATALEGGEIRPEELRQALAGAEEEAEKADGKAAENRDRYYKCILKGYSFLGEEEDAENLLRVGEICLKDETSEKRSEVMGYMARAYEQLGETRKAAEMYERQAACETDETVLEEIYRKASELFSECGQADRAQKILRDGIGKFPQSAQLRIGYIRVQLQDPSIERSVCIQNIQQQVEELPQLLEQEDFQKLMKEYGVKVEGENIWQKD